VINNSFFSHHGSVESEHLKESLATALRKAQKYEYDFEYSIRKWEEQKGYPLVTVNFNGTHFRLQQKMFYTIQETAQIDCIVPEGQQVRESESELKLEFMLSLFLSTTSTAITLGSSMSTMRRLRTPTLTT
jgi:hypothetical protein